MAPKFFSVCKKLSQKAGLKLHFGKVLARPAGSLRQYNMRILAKIVPKFVFLLWMVF